MCKFSGKMRKSNETRARNECHEPGKYLSCEQTDAEYPVIFMMIKNTCIIVNYLMLVARLQVFLRNLCHNRNKTIIRMHECVCMRRVWHVSPFHWFDVDESMLYCHWNDTTSPWIHDNKNQGGIHPFENQLHRDISWHKCLYLEQTAWLPKWKNVNSYLISCISHEQNLGIVTVRITNGIAETAKGRSFFAANLCQQNRCAFFRSLHSRTCFYLAF